MAAFPNCNSAPAGQPGLTTGSHRPSVSVQQSHSGARLATDRASGNRSRGLVWGFGVALRLMLGSWLRLSRLRHNFGCKLQARTRNQDPHGRQLALQDAGDEHRQRPKQQRVLPGIGHRAVREIACTRHKCTGVLNEQRAGNTAGAWALGRTRRRNPTHVASQRSCQRRAFCVGVVHEMGRQQKRWRTGMGFAQIGAAELALSPATESLSGLSACHASLRMKRRTWVVHSVAVRDVLVVTEFIAEEPIGGGP